MCFGDKPIAYTDGLFMKTFFLQGKNDWCASLSGILILTVTLFLSGMVSSAAATPLESLQEEDCAKCHLFQQQTIKDWGGKHATEVGCLDCHPEHPPEEKNTIAACSLCHSDQPHFQLTNCRDCHIDPHKPLAALQDTMKPAREECLTCHGEVGEAMSASPSRHEKLYCTRCHNRHGFIPSCLQCHASHDSSQINQDCLRCHSAHSPLRIVPNGWIPEQFCQVCHKKEGMDLAETKTNHGGVNCIYCHQGQHPSIPSCQDCHGLPHDRLLHSKFRGCLTDCHGDAHRLVSNR